MRCQCGKYMQRLSCVMWMGAPCVAWGCVCGERAYTPVGETVTPNPAQRQPKLKGLSV